MEGIAIGAAANLSSEAIKGLFQEIKRHVRYAFIHKKNVEKFERKMELLIAKRRSVQQEVDAAENNVEKIKADVQLWCERADETIDGEVKKVKDLEEQAKAKCFLGLCPSIKSRYRLSKKAEEDVVVVDELLQQGQFDKVAVRDVPEVSISAAAKDFKAFDSRKEVFEEIMEALKDSTVNMIGVYGIGGVGKTTLVHEVARQVQEANLFCPVVQVDVTQTPNIENIQDQIAESLSLKLGEKSITVRAGRLSERLKKEKKILIVLDDIWARLNLEKVGIRFGDQHKECKILLTSRNRNVLTDEMDAKKTFSLDVLKENEAWDLFKKMGENDFENPEVEFVVTDVVKKCAGLPLAIVTVARALRNKELAEWRDALLQLQRPSQGNFTGIPEAVYSAIQLSYDYLKSEELKMTFLLSCLLGNNGRIQDLLRYAMGLHLFDGVYTVEETRNRVSTMVSKLKVSCLLLDGYNNDRLVMHDFVWDVALAIASRDNHAFALRPWDVLEDWPDEERMEKVKMICLSFASIKKLPHELECPQLRLFSMDCSREYSHVKMPTSFFEKMKNIKVLDLIQMDFSFSPSSVSLPTSLRTLCLRECMLGDMVNLGKLKNLEILSLSKSNIEMLPEEMGQLTKLRLLDLTGCSTLRTIPPGVLSSFSRLEELYMSKVIVHWNQQGNALLDELKELSCLTTLDICILDAIVPNDLFSERLQRYKILIGVEWSWRNEFEYSRTLQLKVNTSVDHLDLGFKGLLKKTEALHLENLEGVEIVLSQVDNGDYLLHLNYLGIKNASEIQFIVNDKDAVDEIAFHQLRSLTLENLPRLISFCSTSLPQPELPLFGERIEMPRLEDLRLSKTNVVGRIWHNQFFTLENLANLEITDCDNLKDILSSSMAKSLIQLKSFEIRRCKLLIEIIFSDDIKEDDKVTISFPQLSTLGMERLEHFIGFCSENYNIVFPSLKKLKIGHCPKLNGFIYKSTTEDSTPPSVQVVFDEKVTFPQLEELRLDGLKNCRKIWNGQLVGDSFSNLNNLFVCNCDKLLNIFSFNMSKRLQNLVKFVVQNCDSLEEIFELRILSANELHAIMATPSIAEETTTSFVFPKLTFRHFNGLPKLKSFYSKIHTTEWPSLKRMELRGCDMVEIVFASKILSLGELTNQQSLFWLNEVTFPNLEELSLHPIPRKIWHGQLGVDVFRKLRVLKLNRFLDTSPDFPNCFIQSLPNLEKLVVTDAAFSGNEIDAVTLTSLNELSLVKLSQLTHLWKEEYSFSQAFCKLRSVEVWECNKLKNLVSSSVSFENLTTLKVSRCHGFVNLITCSTAKSLVQLTSMSIVDCDMIEEIIESEGDEVKGGIVFTYLKYLELNSLPSLANFCSGKHTFKFPTLEKVIVIGCPEMKIFSQGDLSTPMLRRVEINESEDEGCWEGNLNTTIQWMFAGKVGYRRIKQLLLSDSSNLMKIWRSPQGILSFKSLEILEVDDCSTLSCLFTVSIALDLPQLWWLVVKNCTVMEHIILDEGPDEKVENKIVFPQLRYITLESCVDLASFYQGSKILKCPSLIVVKVIDCPKMFAFASTFSREQRLEAIDDGENTSRLSIDAPFFNNMVEFLELESLTIQCLENCRKMWHEQFVGDSFSKLNNLFVLNCEKLLNVFPFNMSQRLQNLEDFYIENCDLLEEIFEPQAFNANELYTATESIVFTSLEYLHLSYLPSLASFCSEKHNFEFPALKKMTVSECPKMKIFCQGNLSTPQLQKVIFAEDEDGERNEEVRRWEGNLNTTIQRLFEETSVQNPEEDRVLEESNAVVELVIL